MLQRGPRTLAPSRGGSRRSLDVGPVSEAQLKRLAQLSRRSAPGLSRQSMHRFCYDGNTLPVLSRRFIPAFVSTVIDV